MADTTTTALRKAGAVNDDQINAAVDAVIGDEEQPDLPIAKGYTLDVPKALDDKPYLEVLSSDRPGNVHNMARTAILVATLDKA